MRHRRGLLYVLRHAPATWMTRYSGRLYRALLDPDPRHVDVSNPSNDYRYNRRGTFPVLYVTDDRETALWETRQRVQTAAGIFDAASIGARTAVYDVAFRRLLDVTKDSVIEALGTNVHGTGNWLELTDTEYGAPTQWLGEAAYRCGRFSGLVLPSTYPGRRNVVIMPDRLARGEHVEFVGFEEP